MEKFIEPLDKIISQKTLHVFFYVVYHIGYIKLLWLI